MLSAQSTADSAAIRRLSVAAHSQKPFGFCASCRTYDLDLLLSRRIHVAGRLLRALQHVDVLAGDGCNQLFILRGAVQLNVKREGMAVEDGRLQQHQRRHVQLALHDAAEMALNALFHGGQRRR